MDISVVIPNYNGKNLIKNNLPKVLGELKKYKNGKTEVIVVDDCSVDSSLLELDKLKQKYVNLKVFVNEKNLGFSSTVNNGVSHANGDIVLLFNTDVYPEKGFLEPLIMHFRDKNVFAVGCMDKSIEGKETVLRGRGVGDWKRGFLAHRRGEVDKNSTLWVSGGSGAFRRSVWKKLGGLNTLYNPFYWEDIDLSYRAIKSGYKIFFEGKSVVYHEHEKGAIKSHYSAFKIKTIAYRNQFIFAWSNMTDINLQILHLIFLPYHFMKALIRGDIAFFIGFLKAFLQLNRILNTRSSNTKLFMKTDEEVIDSIAEE